MPFGLKNAEATYQRMKIRMFKDKIGWTVEVYIDDMVVKSKKDRGMWSGFSRLKEVFNTGTYVISSWARRGFVYVSFGVWTCCKCYIVKRDQGVL